MESEQIAKLQRELQELKDKSQHDQRRIVKLLREKNDAERQKIIEDYESRLAKQTQKYEGNIKSKQSELDRSSERLTIMTNMVDKLKQARIDLLEKIERKESEYLAKEELLSEEIQNLKSELTRMKKSNADDNQSLQEISAGYMLEISQLQEQLAATRATLQVIQEDGKRPCRITKDSDDNNLTILNDSDRSEDLVRTNKILNEKFSELESMYNASLQKCKSLETEIEREASKTALLQKNLVLAPKSSTNLERTIAKMNEELDLLRENESKSVSVIADLESENQRLLAQKKNLSDNFVETVSSQSSVGPISDRLSSENGFCSYDDQIAALNKQVSSYRQRVSDLEAELNSPSPSGLELSIYPKDENHAQGQLNSDNQLSNRLRHSSCDKCETFSVKIAELETRLQEQSTDDRISIISGHLSVTLELLRYIQGVTRDQSESLRAFRKIFKDDQAIQDEYQIKCDEFAQFELNWHEICSHQQDVITALIALQSDNARDISATETLQQTNERLKQIIKEQIEQHKLRISDANDKISSLENLLASEKKKVQQLVAALKKMKESATAAADSAAIKQELESVVARAESAEKQVAHLQKSIEIIELAQKESVKEHKSYTAKIGQLTSALQAEQEHVKTLDNEKQQISSLLTRANETVAELKDVNLSFSSRLSLQNSMISSHWLLDMLSVSADGKFPEFEVNQRCRVNDVWWLFIHVRSDDEITSRYFWTTIEAFDCYSGRKINTGIVADTELVESRNVAVLSSGVSLPESIESQSEANLKAKFDKKWNSAAKKFEKKIAELNQKLRSSQSEIDRIVSEFEKYKKQATLALEQTSGGAIKMSEMLDEIDLLRQERDSLQRFLQEATKHSVDNTNFEIQRLLNVIETNRASFRQSELKWSQELQLAQVENERLINKNQKEGSALVESLNERLKIAQDELQRTRSSATEIIEERDNTISGLHKQLVAAQENCQDLQRQIRILQAELVSRKQSSPRQTHRSVISDPSELFQQQRFELSPQYRRSSGDSADQSVQIQKLQSLLRDAELQREHQAAQMRQLQSQVRELSKSNERSGANLDYLKHVVVKFMETDERLALLPVIANILAFDPEETERIHAKLEKSNASGLIPKIW